MLNKVKKIVAKGESAHDEQLHHWPQCFQKSSAAIASAGVKGLNMPFIQIWSLANSFIFHLQPNKQYRIKTRGRQSFPFIIFNTFNIYSYTKDFWCSCKGKLLSELSLINPSTHLKVPVGKVWISRNYLYFDKFTKCRFTSIAVYRLKH